MPNVPGRAVRRAALVVALVAGAPAARALQDAPRELFHVPRIAAPEPETPPGCARARERAAELLPEVEADIPPAMQTALRAIAADHEPDETLAEGWDYAASLAHLDGDTGAALWAELLALQLEWRPDFATDTGVYLHALRLDEDALLFLQCAYEAEFRSPFLLEALANVHRRAGDGDESRRFIRDALAAAPADPILQVTAALIETGQPPPPPPPAADPLGRALAELIEHQRVMLATIRQTVELQNRLDKENGEPELADNRNVLLDSIQRSNAASLESLRPMIERARSERGEAQRLLRNSALQTLIILYVSATQALFTSGVEVPNPWSGSDTLDIGFWSEVLGYQPVQLARVFRGLRDFEYDGHRSGRVGGWLDDFAGAPYDCFTEALAAQRHDESRPCFRLSGDEADACLLEVDRQWCAAQRRLLRDYIDETERWFQRANRGFDRAAARRLAWGAELVEDAFSYASRWAAEMRIAPNDADGQEALRQLREACARLADGATGGGDYGSGPGYLVKHEAEVYQRQKQNSEQLHAQLTESLERTCEPVDRRVLEQLLREQADAMRAMLLDRLLRNFDVEWDPNASCTFAAGKYFRATVDIEGKVSVGGSWKWMEKVLPSGMLEGDGSVDVSGRLRVDFKNGDVVGASAGVEGNGKYGPFTGKSNATFGVKWDEQKGEWTYPVELGGTLGFGLKTKGGLGVDCYPGKARIRFDARAVASDAMAYLESLRSG